MKAVNYLALGILITIVGGTRSLRGASEITFSNENCAVTYVPRRMREQFEARKLKIALRGSKQRSHWRGLRSGCRWEPKRTSRICFTWMSKGRS